ncbi:hypothetical protein [Actinoplanes sp. NPDC049265]|uniref:hypothetical protein n=1 Tax=Actinoplanes sp. NPDC049265 TaxID=3363902 RepID=UPI003719DCA2
MGNGIHSAIYGHRAWSGFLLPMILSEARWITVEIGESARDVLSRLPENCADFFFHVNLTYSARIPLGRRELVVELRSRGITVWNAEMHDMSKRTVQEICARAGVPPVSAPVHGDPGELLVVKTNCNYHGVRENELTVRQRSMLGYESPSRMPPDRAAAEYRVTRRDQIAPEVWNSPHWVVERYVTNAADRFHRVYLAGRSLVVSRVFDASVFKKMPVGIERESWFLPTAEAASRAGVPADVGQVAAIAARVARTARIDYGAFDVVGDDDGGFYLIDINTTPSWGDGGHPDLLAFLGQGLAGARS